MSAALHVYRWPAVLGLASTAGLSLALIYEGWGDAFALVLAAFPIVVVLHHLRKLRRPHA